MERVSNTWSIFSGETAAWFSQSVGMPTKVQQEAWPVIASGQDILVSAPTGTGKTLSAFLVFIDKMKREAREGNLKEELSLIYISPLKSLAGDIRENLRRPLDGIVMEESVTQESVTQESVTQKSMTQKNVKGDRGKEEDHRAGCKEIRVAVRTGDTTQSERRSMIKHPPHILITTPESLYLLLTSKSGQQIIKTAKAVIIDELHALIDTKRGAHMMFSLARLDRLSGAKVQRIGLSATIEPLNTAAEYLSPEGAVIVAPAMEKQIRIQVVGSMPMVGERKKDPIWEEMAKEVFAQCSGCQSVIAFTEGRRYAEKLAYYVNLLGGEHFARVHHGSVSKEQRFETEHALREGNLRLLCATSSMELGIDVGEIDRVLQVGCPRTVSGTMQRLGRAGHNPGRVSVMYMYPRTAPECLLCGMTAELARRGGVEFAKPPRLCLDILSQHLVSMAAGETYSVDEVLSLTQRTYSFRDVTRQDVEEILRMLAGDYEHGQEIPVRPRVLYDRIHDKVTGDTYSRMLAVHAGGTIPDKGLYVAKNEEGVKLGELDEEFVYESRMGDTFLLGAFAWRILRQDKDTVVVTQAPIEGARVPFWKGELKGRSLRTSLQFAAIMRKIGQEAESGNLLLTLQDLGLDSSAADNTADFIKRQIAVTDVLPDDRTILVEHFTDQNGSHQIMVHSLFGRQVNAPLAILMQHIAHERTGINVGCVDEENGFLLYPYGEGELPEGLLFAIDRDQGRNILEKILVQTPLFSMNFRYNSARALMMGMKMGGRQPLWLQRLRSTQMMEYLLAYENHPLIRETRRECLEENWDLDGMMDLLEKIQQGRIVVREIFTQVPSPMSLPLQWQIEAAEMYEYSPSTMGIQQKVFHDLEQQPQLKPSREELGRLSQREKLPENQESLHTLLMMEGDLAAGELEIPAEWLKSLAAQGKAVYVEPGLWVAAEHREEYENALERNQADSFGHIVRRMVYYRGAADCLGICERYFLSREFVCSVLEELCLSGQLSQDDGFYYHSRLYEKARKATVKGLRQQISTRPPEFYAAIRASRVTVTAPPKEQLLKTLERWNGKCLPIASWETVLFPRRVKRYGEAMLDSLMAKGDFFWKMTEDGNLCFLRYEEIDWDQEGSQNPEIQLSQEEQTVYLQLKRRGASFIRALSGGSADGEVQEILLDLASKSLVCADSFVPIRQWQNRDKIKKAAVRQRVGARVMALSAGRWDVVHPVGLKGMEGLLEQLFRECVILARETFKEAAQTYVGYVRQEEISWAKALEVLSIWEFTGRVRRGYFIKGLSGAQFIRKEDFHLVAAERELHDMQEMEVLWLNAADPDQIWGKALQHMKDRNFLNVPGTAVALQHGIPVAVLERQGKVLRCFEMESLFAAMSAFVRDFHDNMLYPSLKRIIIKEYPDATGEVLKKAGFMKEMSDYVIYR